MRTCKVFLVLAVGMLFACGSEASRQRTENVKGYFPDGLFFPADLPLDRIVADGCEEQYNILEEPSLWIASTKNPEIRAFRLLWSTSTPRIGFLCVLIEKQKDLYSLRFTHASELAKGPKKNPASTKRLKITKNQWDELEKLIQRSGFWKAPVSVKEDRGFGDGDSILLEGAADARYHAIDRMPLVAKPAYREIARSMLMLSSTNFLEDWDQKREKDRKSSDFKENPTETPDLGEAEVEEDL